MKKQFMFLVLALTISISIFAQGDEVPQVVKETFIKQYPDAQNVNYQDNALNVWVNFTLNGDKLKANYTKKGQWKKQRKGMDVCTIA